MADFTPYEKYEKAERFSSPLGGVALSPERWTALRVHLTALHVSARQPDLNVNKVTLIRPIEIDGVIFLPGVYRTA